MKNVCEEEVATDSRNQGIFRQASAIPASRQGSSAWSPGLDWATVCRVEFLETVMAMAMAMVMAWAWAWAWDSAQLESKVGPDNVDGQRCTTERHRDTEDRKWAGRLRAMCRDNHQDTRPVYSSVRTLQGVSQRSKVRGHRANRKWMIS
jgi:hypothetical protein